MEFAIEVFLTMMMTMRVKVVLVMIMIMVVVGLPADGRQVRRRTTNDHCRHHELMT